MITKKKLQKQLDNMTKLLDDQALQINALKWGLSHPNFVKLETSHFYNAFAATNSIDSSYIETGVIKTRNPASTHSLIVTYLDGQQCKIEEKCLVKVLDGYFEKYELISYDLTSGFIELRFTVKDRESRRHYKYVSNLYRVMLDDPSVFILDINNDNWIKLPVVSVTQDATRHIVL